MSSKKVCAHRTRLSPTARLPTKMPKELSRTLGLRASARERELPLAIAVNMYLVGFLVVTK